LGGFVSARQGLETLTDLLARCGANSAMALKPARASS